MGLLGGFPPGGGDSGIQGPSILGLLLGEAYSSLVVLLNLAGRWGKREHGSPSISYGSGLEAPHIASA